MTTSLLLWIFFSIVPNRIKREILEKWPIIRKRSWALTVDTWHIELKGEPTVKQSGGGTRGFRGLWVHRVGSPLGRDSCPSLPGWYGCAHEYFPGCGLVYRCQLPLRFAIFVLLNSHLECFFSVLKLQYSLAFATRPIAFPMHVLQNKRQSIST